MKELQEQITDELQAIVKIIEDMTGLSSRWSGKLELVADAEFKGKKPFRCDVFLNAALAPTPERWSTLIHEVLHTVSAGYIRDDYQDFQGWEEGVVEQLQRLFRAEVLARLHVTVEETVFASIEAGHAYNDFIAALERLRRILDNREEAEAVKAFYLRLLTAPIKTRPALLLELASGLSGAARREFIMQFSMANTVLRTRRPQGNLSP